MPSFQRPIIVGLASAFVASSSSPGLVHRTLASTSAIGARSFALSSPARAPQRATKVTPAQATEGASREVKDGSADYHVKSYMEVMADINETKAAAQTKAAEAQNHMKKQAELVRSNPEARKSLNVMPINTNVYLNLPPYNVARQQAGFKTVKFFKAKVEVWLAMTQYRSTEFGFPLGRFAGYWTEVKALFGSGVAKKQERNLVHAVTASYVAFRKAELKGSEEAITETTEAPMRAKVLRDLKLRPRSARVAGGTWEIVKHVQKPSLQSVFRIPVLEKMTCSHCLVRFNTTQQITLPPKESEPDGAPFVKQSTLVENVLFERRDWLSDRADTTTVPGRQIDVPWKVKAIIVDYDDYNDAQPMKNIKAKEMEGFSRA